MKARQQIARLLIYIAARICPVRPGYCFVKTLFGGWAIIDGCLIKQSTCLNLKNGFQWDIWTLPEAWQNDLSNYNRKK